MNDSEKQFYIDEIVDLRNLLIESARFVKVNDKYDRAAIENLQGRIQDRIDKTVILED